MSKSVYIENNSIETVSILTIHVIEVIIYIQKSNNSPRTNYSSLSVHNSQVLLLYTNDNQ